MPILREAALTVCWMIPGQLTFLFLKHDMQNCCFVTLTHQLQFLVSHFNINEIFQASVCIVLNAVLVCRLALLCS